VGIPFQVDIREGEQVRLGGTLRFQICPVLPECDMRRHHQRCRPIPRPGVQRSTVPQKFLYNSNVTIVGCRVKRSPSITISGIEVSWRVGGMISDCSSHVETLTIGCHIERGGPSFANRVQVRWWFARMSEKELYNVKVPLAGCVVKCSQTNTVSSI